MKTLITSRRIGAILILAVLAVAPLRIRAEDPLTTVLQWLGLGAPPPVPAEAGPGSCPTGGGC